MGLVDLVGRVGVVVTAHCSFISRFFARGKSAAKRGWNPKQERRAAGLAAIGNSGHRIWGREANAVLWR